jgi:glycosyltransferase involved in cell wall biosynthesis
MNAGDLPTVSVSVAIWTCDHETFIGQAVESVLAQDYPLLELVIADDNSSDATPRIVADYARRYPHIIKPLFHRGRRSIVANVNRALSACSGELVAILDGDDMYLPGKLSAQVDVFMREPHVVLCRHPVEVFDDRTGATLRIEDPNPDQARAQAIDLVAKGNFVPTASSMMRRAAMPAKGVPTTIQNAPDWILAIETARQGTIARIPMVLARYRVHAAQMTTVAAGEEAVFLDAMRTLSYVEKRYPDLALAVPDGRRVLSAWEGYRRLTATTDIRWINAGLRTALRHDPLRLRLWCALVAANALYLLSRLRGRLKP